MCNNAMDITSLRVRHMRRQRLLGNAFVAKAIVGANLNNKYFVDCFHQLRN